MKEIYNPYTQKVERQTSSVPDYIQATYISKTEIKSPYIAGNKGFIGGELRVGKEGIVIDGESRIIKSNNYDEGNTGWIIKDSGDAEFNNVKIRGDLEWEDLNNTPESATSSYITHSGITATTITSPTIEGNDGKFTGLVTVGTGDNIEIDGSNKWIQSSNYDSSNGWRIKYNGDAVFHNATIRGSLTRSDISGSGKPEDNADVTSDNTSRDTNKVDGESASNVKNGAIRALDGLNSDGTLSKDIEFGDLTITTGGHVKIAEDSDNYIDIYNDGDPTIKFRDDGSTVGYIKGENDKDVSLNGLDTTLDCISVSGDFYVGDDMVVQDALIAGTLASSHDVIGETADDGHFGRALIGSGSSTAAFSEDKKLKITYHGDFYRIPVENY